MSPLNATCSDGTRFCVVSTACSAAKIGRWKPSISAGGKLLRQGNTRKQTAATSSGMFDCSVRRRISPPVICTRGAQNSVNGDRYGEGIHGKRGRLGHH